MLAEILTPTQQVAHWLHEIDNSMTWIFIALIFIALKD